MPGIGNRPMEAIREQRTAKLGFLLKEKEVLVKTTLPDLFDGVGDYSISPNGDVECDHSLVDCSPHAAEIKRTLAAFKAICSEMSILQKMERN